MRRTIRPMILILLSSCLAVSFAKDNGGFAGAYLRMGLGARSISLGNAGAADRASGYSFYYNPALSAFLENRIFSLSYSFLALDRRFNFIGFSMQVPPEAGFSVGWINSGVADISAYNSLAERAGEIEHSANGAYFNFAKRFGSKFSLGLSIKYFWEMINDGTDDFDYSSNGWGWDFGVAYLINKDITLAAVIRDVGSKLKANTSNIFEFGGTTIDKFPLIYNLGVRYVTPYPWLRILYDFEISEEQIYRNHFGIEAVYNPVASRIAEENLSIRLGLSGEDIMAGTGLSFELFGYKSNLDYAFVPSIIDEGSSHIFSWQFFIK